VVLGISVLDLFKLGTAAAGVLPRPGANIVSQGLASAVAPMLSERRLLIGRNLDRATGRRLTPVRREALTNAAIRSYGRYWEDLLRLPTVSTRELAANFDSQGLHHLDEAVASGTGPILAMPHVGRWEWAAAWLTRVHGVEVTAVVEAIEPPELFDWFRNKREALGIHVVPLGPDAVGSISRAIKAGHVVCLLSDRDISGGGPEVEFFGERTRLPAGPVTLALRTGAPILPVGLIGTREVQPPDAKLPQPFRPVWVRIGRPVHPGKDPERMGDHRLLRQITDEVMFEIGALSGQTYVDEYANKKPEETDIPRQRGGVITADGPQANGHAVVAEVAKAG